MAYCEINFKTKKELKRAVQDGKKLGVYNPSGLYPTRDNGPETVEGPHYPKPHKWYAQVTMKDGIIIAVK